MNGPKPKFETTETFFRLTDVFRALGIQNVGNQVKELGPLYGTKLGQWGGSIEHRIFVCVVLKISGIRRKLRSQFDFVII